MTGHLGNTSVQANLGGGEHPPARYRADTLRELPSGSILPFVPPLERGNVTQTAVDVVALSVCAFVVGLFGVCVGISLWFLVFHWFVGS